MKKHKALKITPVASSVIPDTEKAKIKENCSSWPD
jgi:hypothetical protein